MGLAVFPGSFDPLTNGHVDIIERSLSLFDRVVVGVLANPTKTPLFSPDERVALIKAQFKNNKRVEALAFDGLLVTFAKKIKAKTIVRGLRAISDYDYETQMALTNRKLAPKLETVFLVAREENSYISSTVVKQVARYGGDVSGFVPKVVEKALRAAFS